MFLWFSKSPEEPRFHGTGFSITNQHFHSSQTSYAVSEHLSVLQVNTKQRDLIVISAYMYQHLEQILML